MNGKPPLVRRIRDEIQSSGPIPFDKFMDRALYCPELGYYSSGDPHVGRYGDFYTNVSVGAVFGQLVGREFLEMWQRLGSPTPFVICEQGANNAQFAIDVMSWMRQWRPDLYQSCAYWFVEPHAPLEQVQRAAIHQAGLDDHASWVRDIADLGPDAFEGIFFTNELVDSFPVHRVVCRDGVWHQSLVTWEESKSRFVFQLRPMEAGELLDQIRRWDIPSIQNYTAEISLAARDWMRAVARTLRRGFVMTVDYGYTADILYHSNRIDGTLTSYHGHRRHFDPLILVGEQDITAHVNFSALMETGAESGLVTDGYVDQHHFMIGIAQEDFLALQEQQMRERPDDPEVQSAIRAFRTLIHPEIMGKTFKFLIQHKNLDGPVRLAGLRHAAHPADEPTT